MAMRMGERYRCTQPGCGCEIEVTKGPTAKGGDFAPRCCCGSEMEKMTTAATRNQSVPAL